MGAIRSLCSCPSVRSRLLASGLGVALLLVTGCAPGAGGERAAAGGPGSGSGLDSEGRLVIVGGALDEENAPVHHAVLEARQGEGPLCVLPTASGAPERSLESAVAIFRRYAADPRHEGDRPEVTGVWITTDNPEAAADPAIAAELAGCSGYWFVGGDQSRVMRVFRPASGDTPGYRAIMARWREGAVVAGSSAGAAMMSARSIGGGSPAEALAHGVVRDRDDDGEADGDGVWVLPGMGFVDWAIVGQHHLARGRWGRLVVAVLEEEDALGVGIDENTALVYRDGVAEVVGASGVLVVDTSGARAGELPRTATGIRLELLGPGDRLDVRSGAVTRVTAGRVVPPPGALGPDADRESSTSDGAVPARPARADLEADPFADWAFLRLLHAFATGEVEEITLQGDARTLTLRRGAGFTGQAAREGGVVEEAGTPVGLSVGPLVLELSAPED